MSVGIRVELFEISTGGPIARPPLAFFLVEVARPLLLPSTLGAQAPEEVLFMEIKS